MSSAPIGKLHLTREHARDLLHGMILIRRFEEKCAEVYTQEKIRGRVEADLYYIENWSVLFDLYILALTPLRLFTSENAY